jgi:hypothetical protein
MGGYDEDMDDAKMAIAEEAAERAELDYRLSAPHCTCGEGLEWDANLRVWKCTTQGCHHCN